jgi:hypothetical protein
MDDIVEWFEFEFGPLGFSLTPLMYDPYTFSPVRGVRFKLPNGGPMLLTRIRITPNMNIDAVFDITSDEYKELIRNEIVFFLENEISNINKEKDFKPTKKINKLKL